MNKTTRLFKQVRQTEIHVIKEAAVAGTFYTAEPEELRKNVTQLLNKAQHFDLHNKLMIVPHAGYLYSGEVAASAFKGFAGQNT